MLPYFFVKPIKYEARRSASLFAEGLPILLTDRAIVPAKIKVIAIATRSSTRLNDFNLFNRSIARNRDNGII